MGALAGATTAGFEAGLNEASPFADTTAGALADAAKAHSHMEDGAHFGKIVLKIT